MFLRNRDEAMEALAAIVALPERREQIIGCTVAIMQCLDPEARTFMADCQAMLIEGGLEALRQKRREALAELQDAEMVVVEDPEEDRQLEALATAADALRFAGVVHAVFPGLAGRFEKWEIARALTAQEEVLRAQVVGALKSRGDAANQARVEAVVEMHLPAWRAKAEKMLRAVRDTLKSYELEGDPEAIFTAIAVSDDRAIPFLESIDRNPAAAVEAVRRLQEWTATVRSLDRPQPGS